MSSRVLVLHPSTLSPVAKSRMRASLAKADPGAEYVCARDAWARFLTSRGVSESQVSPVTWAAWVPYVLRSAARGTWGRMLIVVPLGEHRSLAYVGRVTGQIAAGALRRGTPVRLSYLADPADSYRVRSVCKNAQSDYRLAYAVRI